MPADRQEARSAASRYSIKLERIGWLWGWVVFRDNDVAAMDIIPRLSQRSARRTAKRALRRVKADPRPSVVRFRA